MTSLLREPLVLRVSTIAVAALLASMPVTIGSDMAGPAWKVALADKGGNGGGGGNHGGGNQANGHAYGHDKNGGGHGRDGEEAEYYSFGDWVDDVRGGKAFGHARRDEHVEHAKGRYQEALGKARGHQTAGLNENGEVAHRFSPKETKELIERDWRARTFDDGFRNHGQRVRTMVELAKQLGYGARVGRCKVISVRHSRTGSPSCMPSSTRRAPPQRPIPMTPRHSSGSRS